MFDPSQYQLLDFGQGRKLEQFGDHLLDRPSPAAEDAERLLDAEAWGRAETRYVRRKAGTGEWSPAWKADHRWAITHASVQLELKPTNFGHLGVFPEHAAVWDWVAKRIRAASDKTVRVLNLFAYTGAATLAAAAAGAEVTHVDSAQNVVQWARRNAELSGLEEAPVRWIAEDAMRFAQRELKRGRSYHAIILDPPTYGHGPKGETWKVVRDLAPLLETCAELTRDSLEFVFLSCHSEGYGPAELEAELLRAFFGNSCQAGGKAGAMQLATQDGRRLNCGHFARWPA